MSCITRRTASALLTLSASVSAAQVTNSSDVEPYRRSELAATFLAVASPGLGHFYAEEWRRAGVILGGGSLAVAGFSWLLADSFNSTLCIDLKCADGPRWHTYAQGVMIGVGLGTWAWGIYDARLAVRRQRRLRNLDAARPDGQLLVIPAPDASALYVGMRWKW